MKQLKRYPIDYMRLVIFIALFLSISCGTLQCQASENEKFSALAIDNSSVETHVYDLYLRSYSEGHWGVGHVGIQKWVPGGEVIKKDILIKAGDTQLTIPFKNIKEMEFEWREKHTCTIITNKNERIYGKPIRVEGWSLKGETNFGNFSLDVNKVKKVIFRPTQIEIQGFSIQDIQKSSDTAPEIKIEPIKEQQLPNTTVLLSGNALSDSGIKSVTVNGQYAGTDYWSIPIDLSIGDNNILIVAIGNDDSKTVVNTSLAAFTSITDMPPPNNPNPIEAGVSEATAYVVATILIVFAGWIYKKIKGSEKGKEKE